MNSLDTITSPTLSSFDQYVIGDVSADHHDLKNATLHHDPDTFTVDHVADISTVHHVAATATHRDDEIFIDGNRSPFYSSDSN